MINRSRRKFLRTAARVTMAGSFTLTLGFLVPGKLRTALASTESPAEPSFDGYNPFDHLYAYVIDLHKCIGCGSCVQACKIENNVPDGYYRTWVERYQMSSREEGARIDSPSGGINGFPARTAGAVGTSKALFVPKMCNHCEQPPCVQVCPFGASYKTPDGLTLVDRERCMGCGYCVQACPYAARWINPDIHMADKCTWCYHRITKGLMPACVQACPTGTRSFGDTRDTFDPINEVIEEERVGVLQPVMLTKPKCYYLGLDKEVR